ncbi:MAG: spore cortex-lytic enzyme [Bacillota bacterium]
MQKYRTGLLVGLVFLLVLLAAAGIVFGQTGALYYGSEGPEVSRVQERLRNWGYLQGDTDGVFGQQTFNAVKLFQERNGLRVTGTVDTDTLNALGLGREAAAAYTPTRGVSTNDDVMLLSRVIHAEAKGEPFTGKVAVGAVILNRIESPIFPNSLSGVLFQPRAFESVSNGTVWNEPDAESVRAAQNALSGWDPSYGCLYFWNPATSTSKWIWSKKPVMRVGKHVFAR